MNQHRVTFHGISGGRFQTIIEGDNVQEKVKSILKDGFGRFEEEGKQNRFFEVRIENIEFIEYQLLRSEGLTFQSLQDLRLDELSALLQEIEDYTIIQAIYPTTGKEKEKISVALDMKRWERIKKKLSNTDYISAESTQKAQQIILDKLQELINNQVIRM